MHIQFNCPKCGLVMQASTDSTGGAAECPECGKQFVVEASPPVVQVVQARAVPTPDLRMAPQGQVPGRTRSQYPAPAPQPYGSDRPRYQAPVQERSNSRMPIYGLTAAASLLVVLIVLLNYQGSKPKPVPTPAPEESSALSSALQTPKEEVRPAPKSDPDKDKMTAELQKIKETLAAKEAREEEAANQEERLRNTYMEEVEKRNQAQYASLLNYYADNFFSGDSIVAAAFLKVRESVLVGLSVLMNDGNTDNDPKTEAEAEAYVVKRLIANFETNPTLSKWVKDHERDPQKFIPELIHKTPQHAGSGPKPEAFDFSKYASSGSAFWISSDGWILTNEHVVKDSKVVDLRLRDGSIVEAKVVKTDGANDLALLKAVMSPSSWLSVSKGAMDLQLGRTVFTVGYPDPWVQGVEPKFTDGRISAASGIGDRKDSYQTTVPVQHGNSGGPLVDFTTGWVVGVVNARLESRSGVGADNVSYAIKGNVVSTFFESVSEAKAAASKTPPKPVTKGDERAVIDRVRDSSVLILRPR